MYNMSTILTFFQHGSFKTLGCGQFLDEFNYPHHGLQDLCHCSVHGSSFPMTPNFAQQMYITELKIYVYFSWHWYMIKLLIGINCIETKNAFSYLRTCCIPLFSQDSYIQANCRTELHWHPYNQQNDTKIRNSLHVPLFRKIHIYTS